MFLKLLKHEWQGSRRIVGLLCAVIALSGLLTGGSMRYITWSAVIGNDAMVVAYSAVLTAALLAIIGCSVLAMYLLAYRFYKSRFTEQGYLMLTLPVTTHQHLLASISNTLIGVSLVGITALVSVTVGIGAFMSLFDQSAAEELWWVVAAELEIAAETLGYTGGTMALLIPLLLITLLADVVLFMLALTVGAQAHRHPVLKGAAVYILTDMVVSEGCRLIGELLGNKVMAMAVSGVIYGALAVGAYLVMHHIIDKRLNLT